MQWYDWLTSDWVLVFLQLWNVCEKEQTKKQQWLLISFLIIIEYYKIYILLYFLLFFVLEHTSFVLFTMGSKILTPHWKSLGGNQSDMRASKRWLWWLRVNESFWFSNIILKRQSSIIVHNTVYDLLMEIFNKMWWKSSLWQSITLDIKQMRFLKGYFRFPQVGIH